MSKAPKYIRDARKKSTGKNSSVAVGEPKTGLLKRTVKIIAGSLSAVATVFGLVSGVLYFLPNVTVAQTAALNPSDPFSAPFIVTNSGNFPLAAVGASCEIVRAVYEKGGLIQNDWTAGRQEFGELSAGQQDAVRCQPAMVFETQKMLQGDVNLVMYITPMYAPWIHKTKSFHFVTAKSSDGNLIWLPALNTPKS